MPKIIKPIKRGLANPRVKATNNLGIRYPRWHAKHPSNNIIVPQSVAPTR